LNKGSAFTEQERKFFQGLSWIKSHIQGSRLHYSVNVSNWIMTGSKIVYVSRQHQLDQISHLIKRGLWLYVVFALLVAIPMFQGSLSAKITDVTLGLYGLIYHVLLVALFMGEIVQADINAAFMNTATLLIVVIIAMLINFKAAMASES
jgi:hypothetical protein